MASPVTFSTREAPERRLLEIRRLCELAFGGEFSSADWQHALGGHHVLIMVDDAVVSHAAIVERELTAAGAPYRTGYVEAVATLPDRRGEGFGSDVMRAANEIIVARHELGALSTGARAFYSRLGWESWRGPTYVETSAGTRRSADDDDGIMVLRFARSRGLELTAPLVCREREGDDW